MKFRRRPRQQADTTVQEKIQPIAMMLSDIREVITALKRKRKLRAGRVQPQQKSK
jgi:hypothetical protein